MWWADGRPLWGTLTCKGPQGTWGWMSLPASPETLQCHRVKGQDRLSTASAVRMAGSSSFPPPVTGSVSPRQGEAAAGLS